MKKILVVLLAAASLAACKGKRKIPDVSKIKVKLSIQRFDRDFFSIDTNNVAASLDKLQQQYPLFINDYLYNILALPPMQDSILPKLKLFIRDYKPVYDPVQKQFASMETTEKDMKRALQFVQYYFPGYKSPSNIVTFIGPLEGYGNVLTGSGFAVGLQMYLGKNFSAYQADFIREVYPDYQSRRFEPAYIPVNCTRNLIDDMYPLNTSGKNLIEQMVELGKRMYILDMLLPETADTLKTGYTANQLKGCYDHEALIWNYFTQNELLYVTDPVMIRDYVNDGPKTTPLGEASPGNIGMFIGWQIVKKWMDKNNVTSLPQLMATPAKQIFEETKYKPR